MVHIRVVLDEETNNIIRKYMFENNLPNKSDAITKYIKEKASQEGSP